MFAPRLGVVYDWTKVAKGKLFGHWGRFYESVPMQINDRSFGGEVFDYSDFISLGDDNQCGPTVAGIGAPDGNNCLVDPDGRAGQGRDPVRLQRRPGGARHQGPVRRRDRWPAWSTRWRPTWQADRELPEP
jgi:hypothetical protein